MFPGSQIGSQLVPQIIHFDKLYQNFNNNMKSQIYPLHFNFIVQFPAQ